MMLIDNIAELVVVPAGPIVGRAMRAIPRIPDAALLIDNERIAWFGPRHTYNGPTQIHRLSANGGAVVPGLVDCHTHAMFVGSRAHEFVWKLQGRSYAQIAAEGGGILTTVDAVRAASVDQLIADTRPRLQRMMTRGVTTVEIKSGYGLSVEHERKMLLAIQRLSTLLPLTIVPTWLAAHTVPREFNHNAEAYLATILADEVFVDLQANRMAQFCDVFCEQGAFTPEQSRRVLTAAQRFGLGLKIHAEQLSNTGATIMACELGATSADHLEQIDPASMTALTKTATIPVVLPGCAYFMGLRQAPARQMLQANLPLAIATDYNPGSCMVESLPLIMNIACTQMRLLPIEVLVAVTANAAAAIAHQHCAGAIQVAMPADLVILDVPSVEQWMYEPGRDCVRSVLKGGQVVSGTHPE